jgi:allantoate deiminase
MLGIDVVEALRDAGRRLPFAIEVIAFGDEEGSRFSASMSCSRAIAGTLDPTAVLGMRDADGVSLADAFSAFGLDPTGSPTRLARRRTSSLSWKPTSSKARCWKPKVWPWASSPPSPRRSG